MHQWTRILSAASLIGAACRPCEDDCREYVELALVSANVTGEFGSAGYGVVLNGEGKTASCDIDVAMAVGVEIECEGDAVAFVDDGSGGDTESGGSSGDGKTRLVVRWFVAPAEVGIVVRDAAAVLVVSNTLTPAYGAQSERACDGQCRSFERDVVLPP